MGIAEHLHHASGGLSPCLVATWKLENQSNVALGFCNDEIFKQRLHGRLCENAGHLGEGLAFLMLVLPPPQKPEVIHASFVSSEPEPQHRVSTQLAVHRPLSTVHCPPSTLSRTTNSPLAAVDTLAFFSACPAITCPRPPVSSRQGNIQTKHSCPCARAAVSAESLLASLQPIRIAGQGRVSPLFSR